MRRPRPIRSRRCSRRARRRSASRSTTTRRPQAVPEIRQRLADRGLDVPLIGDFHYNGHLLLTKYPECAAALDKYRINPGNVGSQAPRRELHAPSCRPPIDHDKPVRIGVNWGSLDQDLLTQMMDANAVVGRRRATRRTCTWTRCSRARCARPRWPRRSGSRHDKIIVSAKISRRARSRGVLPPPRRALRLPAAPRSHRGRHGHQGRRRVERRARHSARRRHRRHHPRVAHAQAQRRSHARKCSWRSRSCSRSACARSRRRSRPARAAAAPPARSSSTWRRTSRATCASRCRVWRETRPGVVEMKVAVMGCVVNGPGESKHANIGISLPGTFEEPKAPVYVDGKLFTTLKGDRIVDGVPRDPRGLRREELRGAVEPGSASCGRPSELHLNHRGHRGHRGARHGQLPHPTTSKLCGLTSAGSPDARPRDPCAPCGSMRFKGLPHDAPRSRG